MKTVLNIVTTILVILFFGWQFLGNCCEKECDYTKCDKSEIKEECQKLNLDETNVEVEETTEEVTDEEETTEEVTDEESTTEEVTDEESTTEEGTDEESTTEEGENEDK